MSINTNQIDINEIDGYARQVVGGYVWYVQGVKQPWSKHPRISTRAAA
jgi:deoxyribodipyrimidine photolyase-like uncharacterized protein